MRRPLQHVRTRVERLAVETAVSACAGQHVRLTVCHVEAHEEPPAWPPADAPTRCECSAELDYRRVVHVYAPALEVPNLYGEPAGGVM